MKALGKAAAIGIVTVANGFAQSEKTNGQNLRKRTQQRSLDRNISFYLFIFLKFFFF